MEGLFPRGGRDRLPHRRLRSRQIRRVQSRAGLPPHGRTALQLSRPHLRQQNRSARRGVGGRAEAGLRSVRSDDGQGQSPSLRTPRPAFRAVYVLGSQEAGLRRRLPLDRPVPRLSGKRSLGE